MPPIPSRVVPTEGGCSRNLHLGPDPPKQRSPGAIAPLGLGGRRRSRQPAAVRATADCGLTVATEVAAGALW